MSFSSQQAANRAYLELKEVKEATCCTPCSRVRDHLTEVSPVLVTGVWEARLNPYEQRGNGAAGQASACG